jgi:hypothetical protein
MGLFFSLHLKMRARHALGGAAKLFNDAVASPRLAPGLLINWGNRDGRYRRKLPLQLRRTL